jgi:hypothetical protein
MKLEYDPEKSSKNLKERGLPFDMVFDLEWDRAVIIPDNRKDYGEKRLIAFVPFRGRLYVVCYTSKKETRRIISFRKANDREVKKHG